MPQEEPRVRIHVNATGLWEWVISSTLGERKETPQFEKGLYVHRYGIYMGYGMYRMDRYHRSNTSNSNCNA
jgi:hypothetical protein